MLSEHRPWLFGRITLCSKKAMTEVLRDLVVGFGALAVLITHM